MTEGPMTAASPVFFRPSNGVMLEEYAAIDPSAPVDFYHFKAIDYDGRECVLDRPALIFVRSPGHLEVFVGDEPSTVIIDVTTSLFLPARQRFRLVGYGSFCEVMILAVSPALLSETALYCQVSEPQLQKEMRQVLRFVRTLWINEIGHRYFFERVVCRKSNNIATRFLEVEILKEFYYASVERGQKQGVVPTFFSQQTHAKRAVAFIEDDLFGALSLERIAKGCAISRAVLLRSFKSEMGKSPFEYIQDRRLQEATTLLRSGSFSIAEVADRVGYQSASAFSYAFKKRYGKQPSAVAAVAAVGSAAVGSDTVAK